MIIIKWDNKRINVDKNNIQGWLDAYESWPAIEQELKKSEIIDKRLISPEQSAR